MIPSPMKKLPIEISSNLVKMLGTDVVGNNLDFLGFEKPLVQFTCND